MTWSIGQGCPGANIAMSAFRSKRRWRDIPNRADTDSTVSSGLVLNVLPTLMTPDASELDASKGKSGCLSSGFEYHSCNQLVWNFGAIEMKDSSL
jgi:hypothetical protein